MCIQPPHYSLPAGIPHTPWNAKVVMGQTCWANIPDKYPKTKCMNAAESDVGLCGRCLEFFRSEEDVQQHSTKEVSNTPA